MKSVLTSIRPRHTLNIILDRKHWEIRRDRPKLDTPFKDYIYCTQNELLTKSHLNDEIYIASKKKYRQALKKNGNLTFSGKVIGEFICDEIVEILPCAEYYSFGYDVDDDMLAEMCLTREELMNYGKGRKLFAWHISELVVYDEPKELGDFGKYECKYCGDEKECFAPSKIIYCSLRRADTNPDNSLNMWICDGDFIPLTRPPQSWCYVEALR